MNTLNNSDKKKSKKTKEENKLNSLPVSNEMINVLDDFHLLDLNSESDVFVANNHVQVGKAVKFFVKKQKDKEIDEKKAAIVKFANSLERRDEELTKDNVIHEALSHELKEKNSTEKEFDLSLIFRSFVKEHKSDEYKSVKAQYHNSENKQDCSNTENDNVHLRGFVIPIFKIPSLLSFKKATAAYETSYVMKLLTGIFLGFAIFVILLMIGRYAGQILNPNLAQVLDMSNISSYVHINDNVTHETPKIYKVIDKKAEIFNSPLFKDVENGDTIYVYENSKKMIIFRDSINKIISVFSI